MLCFEPVLFHCNVLYKKFIFVVRYERNQFGMIMTFGFDSFGMYYSNSSCLLNSRTAIILFLRMSTSIKRLDIMVYVFEYLKIHISAKISITISLMRTYLDIDIRIGDSKYYAVFHFPYIMCTMKHFNCRTLRLMIFRSFSFYLV